MTTPRSSFTKPSTNYDEQVAILRQRGMQVDDPESAKFYLQHLNYYRLSAYWLPFEASHNPHQFHPGTRFEDALNLYIFDRELRLLIMDAIERIEVSARSVGKTGFLDGFFRSLENQPCRTENSVRLSY